MGAEEEALCPLLRGKCVGERCAWWLSLERVCAVWLLAQSLDTIACRLSSA